MNYINRVFLKQKAFFNTQITKNITYRKTHLRHLLETINHHFTDIVAALNVDLNKSEAESYISEILLVQNEIKTMLKNIKHWSKPKHVRKNILNLLSRAHILKEPYGVVLVCVPWNYPFQLALVPLIDALAAGNTAILYVSPYVPNVNRVITNIIRKVFDEKYVAVVNFSQVSYTDIMKPTYDYVFFTGSVRVGKIVMQQAAANLTPLTLELGGKSPCIIDETAKLEITAKRIIRGKLMNSGQTCIAPDYLIVHESIREKLIEKLIYYIEKFHGTNNIQNKNIPKIINLQHFNRLVKTLTNQKIIYGGKSDVDSLIVEPTLISIKNFQNKLMNEEIFGPILPIISYTKLNDITNKLLRLPKPLALYIFSQHKKHINFLISKIQSGDCCINDTIMHITNEHLPFGGVGTSGMGSYHGIHGFNTFSHNRSLVKTTSKIDSNLFYPPWSKSKIKLIKSFSS